MIGSGGVSAASAPRYCCTMAEVCSSLIADDRGHEWFGPRSHFVPLAAYPPRLEKEVVASALVRPKGSHAARNKSAPDIAESRSPPASAEQVDVRAHFRERVARRVDAVYP